MPPIQGVKLLQNRTQWDRTSTSARMLAPVVVKPDTVSNRASTGWLMDPVSRKGTAPMTLSATHPRAVVTNPSFK